MSTQNLTSLASDITGDMRVIMHRITDRTTDIITELHRKPFMSLRPWPITDSQTYRQHRSIVLSGGVSEQKFNVPLDTL